MTVRYRKIISIIAILLGICFLLVGLYEHYRIIIGIIILLVGILYFFRPYFKIDLAKKEFTVFTPLGVSKRIIKYNDLCEIKIEKNFILINQQEGVNDYKIYRLNCNQKDWKNLIEILKECKR